MGVASGPPRTPGEEQRFTLRFQIQLQRPHDLTWRHDNSTGQWSLSSLWYGAVHERLMPLTTFHSKAPELTQLARCTLKRYLLILKRLILESSVRAGSPNFVAAPDGPETCP
jgi:hypothetical protein